MRNRAERLSWIEDMLHSKAPEIEQRKGVVIPSSSGLLCIAFASVIEVTPAKNLKSISFLPPDFCGVIDRGNTLAPVIDVRAPDDTSAPKVLLAHGSSHDFGLCYTGTPHVVNLDECPAEAVDNQAALLPLVAEARLVTSLGSVILLDTDAIVDRVLAQG